MTTIIAEHPPNDVRDWDNQCARCGSSVDSHECESCGGEGTDGHECGEDTCCCLHPVDNVTCDICRGEGAWWVCMASPEWCEAHPLEGRESVERGKIEWFTFDPPRGVKV